VNDFGGLDDKHLASLGRLAVSFGHVEFLTAEILLVFDDEFIVYTSDGVTRQLELIAVLSDERVDDIELKGAIRAWTSRTSQAEESGDARLLEL